ncbi:helix-turn-helix domain-containing protein [Streptococcus sp. 22.1]|uniref:IS30 family transposase n=1 Tax=Streptococcus salivarius TaxID=1304 RepID=A0AA45HTQ3_STRSL|nr:helix-turn-helix domain-containing protein [Streptococcus sp. 22.1]PZD55802.1 hypothetical protein CKU37_08880 [Streptococcus salivarius]
MNISYTHSTRKSRYSHLSTTVQGKISSHLKIGRKPVEIACLLGRKRSTISREVKLGTLTQF